MRRSRWVCSECWVAAQISESEGQRAAGVPQQGNDSLIPGCPTEQRVAH